MRKIEIISSSVRDGRLSHRVALFLQSYLTRFPETEAGILDLKEYGFPLFTERYPNLNPVPDGVTEYVERFRAADGIVVVSPVYNGSFPAALKNVVDLLVTDWFRKPVLVVSVTYGNVPGIGTVQQLQTLLMKLGARVAAPVYTVIRAGEDFSENGIPADGSTAEKYAAAPVEEFLWLVDRSAIAT
ncbi:MAG: NAD(P)H-dependent oxidoreductase [Rikenellaceae bacterium]|nr:NAD(P)H-dependent oxidoreductase [Rikenellaceae bacterium]